MERNNLLQLGKNCDYVFAKRKNNVNNVLLTCASTQTSSSVDCICLKYHHLHSLLLSKFLQQLQSSSQ